MFVIAIVHSTVAAENKIFCAFTALLNIAKMAVCVVLSIDVVEKDNNHEGPQISLTYGIYS